MWPCRTTNCASFGHSLVLCCAAPADDETLTAALHYGAALGSLAAHVIADSVPAGGAPSESAERLRTSESHRADLSPSLRILALKLK